MRSLPDGRKFYIEHGELTLYEPYGAHVSPVDRASVRSSEYTVLIVICQ